jgi:hypothetical protein
MQMRDTVLSIAIKLTSRLLTITVGDIPSRVVSRRPHRSAVRQVASKILACGKRCADACDERHNIAEAYSDIKSRRRVSHHDEISS